ncbi:atrophin-1-like [Nasonia vitripennis]|uniref:Uncharacterized protein n=1 Tax=Nasonia vitripennis TaxID=7425 RepID=A0A7M7HDR8_NASVI|nr:atrophin-1-like [Nasonia vitripennis]
MHHNNRLREKNRRVSGKRRIGPLSINFKKPPGRAIGISVLQRREPVTVTQFVMRLLNSVTLLLVLLGVALAVPTKKRIAKKSISNSLAPRALEPVDQSLDEPAKLSDAALMEIAGENVDRAKKSTKFCVEIRDDKPTQVDCDEIKNRPILPPPPPPVPEPQEPAPPPPPAPAPVPQQQPEEYKFQVPCEPEIAPFYVDPPGEIVYAATGNCAQHAPALLHVPSNNPLYTIPAGGVSGTPNINTLHLPTGSFPAGGAPGSSGPSINVLHLPTGSLPSTGYGVAPTIHINPSAGAGSSGPTVIPLHTTGGAGTASGHTPSVIHLIRPSPLQHGITHGGLSLHGHGGLPLHGHGGLPLHGAQQTPSVECTCRSTSSGSLAKSANGSPSSNEALALKFLQDIQRNAQSSGSPSPMMVQVGPGQPGSPMMMMSSGPGSPVMAGKSDMRYMPPMSNVNQHQVVFQQQGTSMNGMGDIGMHGYPTLMPGYPTALLSGMYPVSILRSNADCLQDSSSNAAQMMPQVVRLSREEAGQEQAKQKTEEKPEEAIPSPGDIVEAILSGEADKADKNSRIARFLAEKDAESNSVLEEK